ncbi:MAG: oligopeptide transport system substrate-binding protein [Myxococcota bacterium]|jgi:oligopeptide transport system substrate-binding protein
MAGLFVAGIVATSTLMIGCGDATDGRSPKLVRASPERIAELQAQLRGEQVVQGKGEALRLGWTAVPPPIEVGPGSYTSDAHFETFINECDALQPKTVPSADGDATADTNTIDAPLNVGEIWRGKIRAKLRKMTRGNVFRFTDGEPEYLDPNLIAESAGSQIGLQLFEGLLSPAPGNTPPRPGAATRYEVSEDGLVYTFHLREGMQWSDGTPLTAQDFHYSWLRALDPSTGSKNAAQLTTFIKGARAFNEGSVRDPETVGVKVVSPTIFEVTLENPNSAFPGALTYVAFSPVPRHVVEKFESKWVRAENIVSNGPFKMRSWAIGDRIELERNPLYWDIENVALDGVIVFFSSDEYKNLAQYQTGEAHWIRPLPQDRLKEWKKESRDDVHIDASMCTYYYSFRVDRAPFDNPQIRRAVNHAIDKKRLTQHVLSAFEVPATGLVPPMFEADMGYIPPVGDTFNVVSAKTALTNAGYPDGKGFPKIELVYNTFEVHRKIADFATRNVEENIGVAMTASNMEWASLLKKSKAGDFDFARASWCADYPDPYNFLDVFASTGSNNYTGYENPAYDAMLKRIREEANPRQRNVLMCASEKALQRDMIISPLYFYTRGYLLRPEVKGFQPRARDDHYLKWVSLEGGGT